MPTNVSLIIQNGTTQKEKGEEGGGKGGSSMTFCLRIDILWSIGNLMSELTLTPL
jgi:hypothetical protein